MSDTRETLAELLTEHGPTEDVYLYCLCGLRCAGEAGYATHLADLILAEFLVVPHFTELEEEWALHEVGNDPHYWPDGDTFESLKDAKKQLDKQWGTWRSGGFPVYYRIISRWRTKWRPVEPAVSNLPQGGAR